MKKRGAGIYYRQETREILSVREHSPDPGDGWRKVSDDPTLGLLAARRRVQELGLVEDSREVDWYGLESKNPAANDALSDLIGRVKRESEERSRGPQDGKPGLLGVVVDVLRRLTGGSEGSGGSPGPGHSSGTGAPHLAPERVRVRGGHR